MRRLLLLVLLVLPFAARAQDPAVLIADRVAVEGSATLIADGNVEVLYGDTRLKARRIAYDRGTGRLKIDGPIVLVEGDRLLILADAALIDADLMNGILTSARVVLDEQLQLAAAEARRVGGRYTELSKAVVSSCEVCARNPVPLWSIRARRVVHDSETRQLYFDHATFRIMDIPVLYLPRLRLPDPSLKRARGLLIPNFRTTSQLGFGFKLPYFIPLGDSRDLTVTPYLSRATRTVELRYRQAYRHGHLSFRGAFSDNAILPGETRAYLFGEGVFSLPRDFQLDFNVELSSDPSYLLDYGYSEKDRLDTSIGIRRVRGHERIGARLINFRTLRDSEIPIEDQLPYLIGEAAWERRFPGVLGGEAGVVVSFRGHERTSDLDVLGRDVLRVGIDADWRRDWLLGPGIVAEVAADVTAAAYAIGEDSGFEPHPSHVVPTLGLTLRWPLARIEGGGATQVLEPVVAVAWSDILGGDVPNEDSTLVEFDEGNLLSLNRFPGSDRHETGLRGAIGVGWTRHDPAGWSLGLTVGRVLRQDAEADFTGASGLDGVASDWLAAAQLRLGSRLVVTSRSLIAPDFGIAKSETRFGWTGRKLDLAATYVWVPSEAAEGRALNTSELTFDSLYRFSRNWTGSAAMRYDIEVGRAASAGLGVGYRNECVSVDLSLSRRFTSSTSVEPTTDVGLRISLNGFGSDRREVLGTCSG